MLNAKWVVLRGLGRGYGHWGSFQTKMKQAFPNDRLYFIDLPGNGLLKHETSPLKISEYIPYLQSQLDMTDFFQDRNPTFGVGLSLGGMIITEWTEQNPTFFKKVFLINTSASNFSAPWKRISMAVFKNSAKQIFRHTLEESELNSLLITTNVPRERLQSEFKEDYESNIRFSKEHPITKKNILRQLCAAVRYSFPEKAKTDAVIICGARDKFVNPDCSEDIAKHWNCKLEIDPQAGHDIAFEDAPWLIHVFKTNQVSE